MSVPVLAQPHESAFTARLQYLSDISGRLTATMNSADRFVNFAGIIAAATITAGILGKKPLIAILAPYALIIIFAYQIQLYTDAERYTVLLEYLEDQINSTVRLAVFRTGSVLDRAYRKRLSTTLMQGLYTLILVASIVVSAVKTADSYSWPWVAGDIACLLVIGSPLLGAAIWELRRAQKQVELSLAQPRDLSGGTPLGQQAGTPPSGL